MQPEKQKIKEDIFSELGLKINQIETIHLGANNKSFICKSDSDSVFVKYFHKSLFDKRDKIGSEWNFLRYLESIDEHRVPSPIAINTKKNFLILSFCEGAQPKKDNYDDFMVAEAASFLTNINKSRFNLSSKKLPMASEHSNSIRKYNDLTERKLSVLSSALNESDEEARKVLEETSGLFYDLTATFNRSNASLADTLQQKQLCISPSDFGFHNVLISGRGDIKFIDFEYAGWDDPAKLICDFVLHPAMNLDKVLIKNFLSKISFEGIESNWLAFRCYTLYDFAVFRWVCIILNLFLPHNLERKLFSNPNLCVEGLKKKQIAEAKVMLSKISANPFQK